MQRRVCRSRAVCGKSVERQANVDYALAASGIWIVVAPVPVGTGRPTTMLAEGEVKSSDSWNRDAPLRNAMVISKLALSSGEGESANPPRLNGLKSPNAVW